MQALEVAVPIEAGTVFDDRVSQVFQQTHGFADGRLAFRMDLGLRARCGRSGDAQAARR